MVPNICRSPIQPWFLGRCWILGWDYLNTNRWDFGALQWEPTLRCLLLVGRYGDVLELRRPHVRPFVGAQFLEPGTFEGMKLLTMVLHTCFSPPTNRLFFLHMPHEMWTWHHGIKVKLMAEVRLPDCFQITAEESPNQDSWCMLKTDDFFHLWRLWWSRPKRCSDRGENQRQGRLKKKVGFACYLRPERYVHRHIFIFFFVSSNSRVRTASILFHHYHPFLDGVFPCKRSSYGGTPMTNWKPPSAIGFLPSGPRSWCVQLCEGPGGPGAPGWPGGPGAVILEKKPGMKLDGRWSKGANSRLTPPILDVAYDSIFFGRDPCWSTISMLFCCFF